MGTYTHDEQSVIETINNALNNIEGDFTQETLHKALKKCKEYPYVCDKMIDPTDWNNFVNEL